MSTDNDAPDRYRAPALDKGLDILELLAEQPHGLTRGEIVKAMGRSQSEIYRMLERLVARHYVTRSPEGDRYALGLKLFVLAHRHPPYDRLVARALPVMDAFAKAAEQSCHLVVYERGNLTVVAHVASPNNWGLSLRLGVRVNLVDTASGHAMLAFQSPQRQAEMLADHEVLEGEVPMSAGDMQALLERVRAQGHWEGESQQVFGVTDISIPLRDPYGNAYAVLTCRSSAASTSTWVRTSPAREACSRRRRRACRSGRPAVPCSLSLRLASSPQGRHAPYSGGEELKQNQRNAAAAAWAIAFVLALSGCGGGGGGGSSAATLATTDDSSSVLWNAPATIDVLVNDSSSQGTVGLVDVTAPSHGTASIAGGRIVYTPAPGYFGPDSMRYTARAAQGGATATATLAVDVRARFNLQGTVGEGATPGAEVVVQLGSTSTTTTADSQGRYSVTLESNQPDAFVDIQATGGAAQPTIKLRSLVGRLGALLAGADAQGTVSAAQHRALDVDAFSTATAVLAMRASGNQLPVTDALFAQIDSELLFDMATVMKKLLTGAAVLPTGAADSLALLGDATAFDAYRTSLTTADYTSFAAVRQAVLAGLAFVAPDPVAVNGEQTLIYFGENKTWQDATYVVAFRPNGTATVHSEGGHVAATWSRTAQKIEVAFSSPLSHFAVVDVETAPATAWIRSSGLVIRKIDGLPGFNTVTVPTTQEYAPGEDRAGEIVTLVAASDAGNLLRRVDQADRLPIAQGEFAVGARWAGFIDFSSFDSQVDYQTGMLPIRQDLVTVTSSGHARSSVSAIDYTYTVADNRLFVGGINGAIVEYVRLRTDSATGEQRWLAMARGGTLGWVSSMVVVSADSSPASLTVAEAARNWSTYAEWDGSFDIALYADGTGLETFGGGGDAPSSRACTWSVSAADGISMARRVFNRTRYRVWLPVKRQAGALWVLETQYDLTDLDPTVPQSLIQRVSRKVERGTTAP